MIKREFKLCIFIICSFYTVTLCQSPPNNVDSIINENSSHLISLIGKWHVRPEWGLQEYFTNPFIATDSLKKYALSNLIACAPYLSNVSFSKKSFVIQDEIVFKICISIMANYSKIYLGEQAFETIYKYARYDHLMKYSEEIKRVLADKKSYGSHQVEDLLSLVRLDLVEKKNILEHKNLLKQTRARLGDTVAENDLIKEYLNEKKYYVRQGLIHKLGEAGTEKCLKELIKNFNDTIVDNNGGCGKESMTELIIPIFGRLYPENQLLNDEFERMVQYPNRNIPTKEIVIYLNKVIEWMKKTYGVSPNIKEPMPFIVVYGICK